MTARTALILGTSAVTNTDSDRGGSIVGMTEARLREMSPAGGWQCLDGLLFFGPTMARRAAALVERGEPQVVVVHLTSRQIVDDAVSYAVLRRWPALFPAFQALSDAWRRLAGGHQDGAPGAWGLVFRGPQWLASRLIGSRPQVEIDDAIACTVETLEELVKAERYGIVCKLPDLLLPSRRALPKHRERIQKLNRAVSRFAQERHIHVLDRVAAIREGDQVDAGGDRRYSGIGLKRAEAGELAKLILEAAAPDS